MSVPNLVNNFGNRANLLLGRQIERIWRAPRVRKRHLLLVEDDEVSRRLMQRQLEREFTVSPANDGEAALRLILSGTSFDALVTDFNLGEGFDGYDVARVFRFQFPRAPIVLVSSAVGGNPRVDFFRRLPMTQIFRKPAALGDLLGALRPASPVRRLGLRIAKAA